MAPSLRDYVRAMHLMLRQDEPDDYVIATGEQHSMRELLEHAFAAVGVGVEFSGDGVDEVGCVIGVDQAPLRAACGNRRGSGGGDATLSHLAPGSVVVRVDPRYFRPTEVETLLGDPGKARPRLGWQATARYHGQTPQALASVCDRARYSAKGTADAPRARISLDLDRRNAALHSAGKLPQRRYGACDRLRQPGYAWS